MTKLRSLDCCSVCGRQIKKVIIPNQGFDSKTGKSLYAVRYACETLVGVGFSVWLRNFFNFSMHTDYSDGSGYDGDFFPNLYIDVAS